MYVASLFFFFQLTFRQEEQKLYAVLVAAKFPASVEGYFCLLYRIENLVPIITDRLHQDTQKVFIAFDLKPADYQFFIRALFTLFLTTDSQLILLDQARPALKYFTINPFEFHKLLLNGRTERLLSLIHI